MSVYRGYYQAYGNMVPTSVSQIVEQVVNAVFSIVATLLFMKWAVSLGYDESTTTYYAYGAAGGTVGTGIALVAGLVYMFVLFRKERKELSQRIKADRTEHVLSYREVFKLLLMIATPIILSSAIYNANVSIDMTIYQKMMASMGMGGDVIDGQYGMYSRIYLPLANVPIAMAAAVASAVIPGISTAYAKKDKQECNRKITQSMQLTFVLTIPCAVGFAVLGKPIARMLYRYLSEAENSMVGMFLLLGGISIVLYGFSSVLNGVLQGMGKVNVPVVSATVALILHVVLLIAMLKFTEIGIYALILATAFYAIIVVIINYWVVRKELDYRIEWKPIVGVPLLSATVMGIVTFITYTGVNFVANRIMDAYVSNVIATLAAICIAVGVYFIAMIKVGGYTKEMLLEFPKGTLLVRFAQKLHLI